MVEKQGGTFLLDKVTRVDPEKKILYFATNQAMSYDVLSFNTGSYVPWSDVTSHHGKDIFSVKPIEQLLDAQARILALVRRKKITVSVIGGGPSAVEIAGNVWRLVHYHGKIMPKIQIFAGQRFMSKFPDKVRAKAVKSLVKRGVGILEQGYVKDIAHSKVTLVSGQCYHSDVTFLAHGIKPSPIFKTSGLPVGPDGGLLVNKYLQSTAYPEIFGGGDCIFFKDRPLDKVGVYAVRENPVLYHNLMASLEGKEFQSFHPGGEYLLILNMGDGTGVLRKKWIHFGGRPAFAVKNFIDKRFMKKFQFNEHL
jgi:NADH dehydrogenase FAD-containing subunit